ncbi:EamA family transporter [Sphingomonas sabuli]|uniref:EamA family transporter n=1 Tax=Sphingomonas sabuli TaxID=2764186 RepID=A0A7G9L1A6_9SPHN|nr:EamA family transporter [Sphingomonas sabuli]QNM82405.1 EamA family transporter [Sphingomonas sabuli]
MSRPRVDLSVVVPFIIFTVIWGSTWIVIRDQLGTVPAQWSIAYRFIIAGLAMAAVAVWKGHSLRLDRAGFAAAAVLGVLQFVINFHAVYAAEHHITSGLVATVFALLLIPNSLLAWAVLGQRPGARFAISSLVAVAGIALLFAHELGENPDRSAGILIGIALTLGGMLGASAANVFQAIDRVRRYPLFALLAWAMLFGALFDSIIALAVAGPPVIETRFGYWLGLVYLALFASALAFSLYLPVVRKIGPGKAAYSSVLVPIIAMGFSTWLEGYRWTPVAAAGALLALGGMVGALSRSRAVVAAPDAA